VNEARNLHPIGFTVLPHRFRGLEEMFDLGCVGIWIRGVDEGIEKFHRFPDPEGGSGLLKGFSAGFDIELDSLLGMLFTTGQLHSYTAGFKRDIHVKSTR
jgi:hypothetical protein